MQKHRNSQGGHQPTAEVCDRVSPNALGIGGCGVPWAAGGEAPGPTVGQSFNFHSVLDGHLTAETACLDKDTKTCDAMLGDTGMWYMWDKPEHT